MKKSETRELIVKTATELFYRKGYNLTGINEIIAEAGIAKATLYSHFRSKEDLCIAYLEYKNEDLLNNIDTFCNEKLVGEDRLIAVLEFLIPFFESDGFNGCWCIRTVAEIPKENEKIRKTIQNQKKGFLAYLVTLVETNLPDLEPEEQVKLASQIYMLYEGAVSESHLHNSPWPIYESIDLLKTVLDKHKQTDLSTQ